MPLYFGSTKINDGDPLLMGTRQCTKVMRGSTQVWINNYISDAPTSFVASNSATANIDFSWTLPVDQGVPVCTYEIRRSSDDVVVATAGAGATTAQFVTIVTELQDFYVVGINVAGESAISNEDSGSSFVGAPSPLMISSNGDYTAGVDFPAGADITVCLVGGGGSGSIRQNNDGMTGGGFRGEPVSAVVNIPLNEIVSAVIGNGGGSNCTGDHSNGYAGGGSNFGSYASALGGAGGINHGAYDGQGAPYVSPCNGVTYYDGSITSGNGRGGQAGGFGNGGNGNNGDGGYNGSGGGGGGGVTDSYGGGECSGAGGKGQIMISW